jgi:hypothetical protein
MVIRTRILAAIAAVALLPGVVAHAQTNSSKQVFVTSANVDRKNDTVTLKGQNLGGRKSIVFCETFLMSVLSATEEDLLVSFPASSLEGTFLFTVIRGNGNNPTDRAYFYVTTSRPQIIQGTEGPAGPQGPVGPQGPQGETGPQGAQGPQGVAGAKGDVGPQGPQGPQGLKGDVGATGAQGPAGAAGAQGPKGDTGLQGQQGPQGLQGLPGAPGAQGPQGLQGPQGVPGPQGFAGVNGVSGYERVQGDSPTLQLAPTVTSSVSVACPAGKRAVAGGFEMVSMSSQSLSVIGSLPVDTTTSSSWRVAFRNSTTGSISNIQVRVHAICAFVQ